MVQLSLLFTKSSSTSLIIPCVYNDNAKLLKKVLHKCKYHGIILRYARYGECRSIAVGKFLAADVECIDCSCQWGQNNAHINFAERSRTWIHCSRRFRLLAELHNSDIIGWKSFSERKLFTTNVQCIKRICAVGAVFEECSFSAGYESGKPMTSDSASFSPPLSFRSSPLALCLQRNRCGRGSRRLLEWRG